MLLAISPKQFRQLRGALNNALSAHDPDTDGYKNIQDLLTYIEDEHDLQVEARQRNRAQRSVTCKLEDPYCSCNRRG